VWEDKEKEAIFSEKQEASLNILLHAELFSITQEVTSWWKDD